MSAIPRFWGIEIHPGKAAVHTGSESSVLTISQVTNEREDCRDGGVGGIAPPSRRMSLWVESVVFVSVIPFV
eukprot:3524450-Pyramimonas_sp.AAC.2